MPFERCHLSQILSEKKTKIFYTFIWTEWPGRSSSTAGKVVCFFFFFVAYRFSMTGTSTACRVLGRRRDPGFSAPHPAAHPNLPKKSSFFSGKQIGAASQSCRHERNEIMGGEKANEIITIVFFKRSIKGEQRSYHARI